MQETEAEIYTDGSCQTQTRAGAWVAIVFAGKEKKILSGTVTNTTHNRMELSAVIKGLDYARHYCPCVKKIKVFSDSQYVIGLPGRRIKLAASGFHTKKGSEIQNADLVKELLELFSILPVDLIKVKAHQKKTGIVNYNIEADKLCRKMVRDAAIE
ncbi:MAG: ribonuclease H family protein [Chitinophagaceae bacterium]